jgi:hypothetical protein
MPPGYPLCQQYPGYRASSSIVYGLTTLGDDMKALLENLS